jgi:2-(1,2-epoxy-1,2-dihydrophenyl)acetyl-CoA isomerase
MSMILSERRGPVAAITLNNPEQYNALGPGMLEGLNAAIKAALSAPEVRAILLTGAGMGFCSGAQFGGNTFDRGEAVGSMMRETVNPVIEMMRAAPKPIVVAVNGAAAGAGVGIALAGDIVIAARSARFILSFARLGAVLDAGTSLFLQRAIGAPRARALALLGEPLGAETAAQWGLIWKCVDDADLLAEATAVAVALAEGPPIALAAIKAQCETAWAASLPETLEREAAAQSKAFVTDDLREGAAAFMEKRRPRFVGR